MKREHGNTKHGMYKTPTYRSWSSMRTRCSNPKAPNFPEYGGRGISVCPRWQSFLVFLADMGVRPDGTSLDRIDNSKGYEPGNCRWATAPEQQNNKSDNRRLDFRGDVMTVAQFSRLTGLHWSTVEGRLSAGWSTERIASTPPLTYSQRGQLSAGVRKPLSRRTKRAR